MCDTRRRLGQGEDLRSVFEKRGIVMDWKSDQLDATVVLNEKEDGDIKMC